MTSQKEKERDINEVFDELLLSEEKVIADSYKEGFEIGAAKGNPEGYHLGYHRGAELGSEIGYYTGVIESYLNLSNDGRLPEKIVKSLDNLKKLLDSFPWHNAEDIDIIEQANIIRAKFKKVCAQLKIDITYPENGNLSF
ncbi:oral cancer-overexpressed protein 1 homolog [Anoplophora glabripennis]|uniref:oral cancer-overexpressed protein 1 homolog n=1 Tax=Anoplophora glabripennis TaxID=217634 RepID=UPI00087543FD|nr:oral cancer-overexpressed protein 1 homolog [Anoplophora glabripennis]